ncbi:MAG: STAS domain-containing protein [Candidatus Krumholzibacteria bacterium]|nr:STAS domain-containing protein [Candidatus Krumholzibacteria bacterium]
MSSIETVRLGDIAVIDMGSRKLSGEKEDYLLWKEVETVLASGVKKIVLDLSRVKWSNSTGIGIMISAWTMAQKEKSELVVVVNSKRLSDIFKVTNLKLILRMYDTLDEALAALK